MLWAAAPDALNAERRETVKTLIIISADTKQAKKKPAVAGLDVVEVRRLELLTPYMRSKCSTS